MKTGHVFTRSGRRWLMAMALIGAFGVSSLGAASFGMAVPAFAQSGADASAMKGLPVEISGPAGPLGGEALTVPGAEHVVVIIPGSGPTDRNGNSPAMGMASNTYLLLAEGLAQQGIASLRTDKRGFFRSEKAIADPNQVTIANYADDVRGWARKAKELAPCVWLAGHSEGALVALEAATGAPGEVCGLILMAAPGRPIGQLMVEQMQANPAMTQLMPVLRSIVADLEAGRTRAPDTIPAPLQGLFSPGLQRYMIDLFSRDPARVAQGWKGPVLILQGTHDIQVRTEDAEMLGAAMPQAETRLLPGATHMLKPDQPGAPYATYTDPKLPLDPRLVPAITTYVKDHAPGASISGSTR
ncbi:alpha/beta hydrolase [Xanthobacter sp. TB0139]|uniref:alpha/beta hydrolase n=1 Tax=Xanthobacter sp. TB0139 TaxID=3459178 RepID=UPI0040393BBD